jgi:ankyrin repeat protein
MTALLLIAIIPDLAWSQNPGSEVFNAINSRDPARLRKALKKVNDVNFTNSKGFTPIAELLFSAQDYGGSHVQPMVQMLIDKGASLNSGKATALDAAAKIWDRELLEMLIQNGASVDSGNPLHIACFTRNKIAVEVFLEHGAVPDKKNKYGKTPAQLLLSTPHTMKNADQILGLLADKGANLHLVNDKGETLLDQAVAINDADAIAYLKTKNVKQNKAPVSVSYDEQDDPNRIDITFSRNYETEVYDLYGGYKVSMSFEVSGGKVIRLYDLVNGYLVYKLYVLKSAYLTVDGMKGIMFEVEENDYGVTRIILLKVPNMYVTMNGQSYLVDGYNRLLIYEGGKAFSLDATW